VKSKEENVMNVLAIGRYASDVTHLAVGGHGTVCGGAASQARPAIGHDADVRGQQRHDRPPGIGRAPAAGLEHDSRAARSLLYATQHPAVHEQSLSRKSGARGEP
jgi:hypothetical protein